jgi:hypothetical protein
MLQQMKTKSGTIVYMDGGNLPEDISTYNRFIRIYNNHFSSEEQRRIGPIHYILNRTRIGYKGKVTGSGRPNTKTKVFAGAGYTDKEKINRITGIKKILMVTFNEESSKNEYSIIHELIHLNKFAHGVDWRKQKEELVEFETIARVPRGSIISITAQNKVKEKKGYTGFNARGYYYSTKIPCKQNMDANENWEYRKKRLLNDRKLLTGSIDHYLVGKEAEDRAKRLFNKSFFTNPCNYNDGDSR